MVRPRVFFDITIDNQPSGRIIFELFNDTVPKTSENFRALCTGEKGLSPLSERPLYYKNSIIHRSIPGFMIQGGGTSSSFLVWDLVFTRDVAMRHEDFTKRNGTGGESIYGGPFPDEDLSRPLDSEGLLCMANKGPNTNNSQFFITLRDCPHLNGKHVVFGRVIRGYDIVERIAQVPTDEKDRPRAPVVIANSGELMLRTQVQQKKPDRGFNCPHTIYMHITCVSISQLSLPPRARANPIQTTTVADERSAGTARRRVNARVLVPLLVLHHVHVLVLVRVHIRVRVLALALPTPPTAIARGTSLTRRARRRRSTRARNTRSRVQSPAPRRGTVLVRLHGARPSP
ncbi:cyclophilin-like domain-containing protein [Trametes polyzona]|nr:cyclophilin-like domain-containing protein [Trametes polyzona]